jgi:four helix bundle protein
MKDFKKLHVWQNGMEIVDMIFDLANQLPSDEKFGIRSQITRSAISIPANIAEGSARRSQKDYKRFLEIALDSAFEQETHVLIIRKRNWIAEERIGSVLENIISEPKMLVKFIEKLES